MMLKTKLFENIGQDQTTYKIFFKNEIKRNETTKTKLSLKTKLNETNVEVVTR